MQYLAVIKKKSPMHALWRRNRQHKARFLDNLFVFNKAAGEYSVQGDLKELGRLMAHPHVTVTVMTAPTGEAAPVTQDPLDPIIPPAPTSDPDPETDEEDAEASST